MADVLAAHFNIFLSLVKAHMNKRLLLCATSAVLFKVFCSVYSRLQVRRKLHSKHQELKERLEAFRASLAKSSSSSEELLALTDLNLTEIRAGFSSKKFTPIDVLHAYQLKALNLFDSGNSGVCEFIQEAEALFEAFCKDEAQGDSASPRSLLYGIPVSVKETFPMAGYDSTFGIIKRCGLPSTEDCLLVKVLKLSGAIPFVLTSTSQAVRVIDGRNHIFGDAVNPYNKSRICGGSSSGEAVLLAQGGSPLGIGSDIGGSIRIPAAFCGLACLKPTINRISTLGMLSISQNSVFGLQASFGPMSQKVDHLADFMRTILTPVMFSRDHQVVPLVFDEMAYSGENQKQLTIGFYTTFKDSDIIQTVPATKGAVFRAAEALTKAGHRVVKFNPPNPAEAYRLYIQSMFADGGREIRTWLSHEPVGVQLKFLLTMLSLPNWIKSACDWMARFCGIRPVAFASTLGGLRNLHAVFDLTLAVQKYRRDFQKAWTSVVGLDAVICPVSAYPAPPSDAKSMFISPSVVYTALYNLLDYPAGTVRVGFVDRADVMEASKLAVQQHLDGDWYGSRVSALQTTSVGLPLCVQVVSKPFHEELVLRVMRIIESTMSGDASDS